MQRSRKIVIADDNKGICDLVSTVFEEMGYKVDSVHNGYELLAYLEKNNPFLIILDLMMPEKDGLSILSTLKEVAPYSRIIIYTGYREYENSVYARTADRFLVKGGRMTTLVEAVQELT
ncbi:MAG: response regulator [Candidatus Omnitrophota bacterium]|nr:response regulator [Candidatus Omnitrophota bacterium]